MLATTLLSPAKYFILKVTTSSTKFPVSVGQDVAGSIVFLSQTVPNHLSPSRGQFSFLKSGVRIRVKSEDNRPSFVLHHGAALGQDRYGVGIRLLPFITNLVFLENFSIIRNEFLLSMQEIQDLERSVDRCLLKS